VPGDAARPSRWFVLVTFGLLVATCQLLWLSYAPITSQAHHALGVSEGAIGDLAVVNPLMYVLLAIPAGRWMDRHFTTAVSAGALLTAAGALLRAVDSSSYGWAIAGQVVVSAGQPLVLNASTKIAARYFPPAERTAAISVASAAQFVGILAATTSGGTLVHGGGLHRVIVLHAVIAVAAAVAVLLALRVPPAYTTVAHANAGSALKWLRHDPLMLALAALLFVGVGVFNAAATWLDSILEDFGHPNTGGHLIALMTVAGVIGAAVLPNVAARRDRRRELLLATTLSTVIVFLAVAAVHDIVFVSCALAVEGFVLLAGLPVVLDWSELDAGPERAATATGLLLLAGNLGGVVLVLLVQIVIGNAYLALGAMALLGLPGAAVALRLPRHARAHGEPVEAGGVVA